MPLYSYICNACDGFFEIVCSYADYDKNKDKVKCPACQSKKVERDINDVASLNTSVKKSDNELKTIGDLARRNTDKMSEDQKASLYAKHNSYKEQPNNKPLPKGMSRMKRTKNKTKWY